MNIKTMGLIKKHRIFLLSHNIVTYINLNSITLKAYISVLYQITNYIFSYSSYLRSCYMRNELYLNRNLGLRSNKRSNLIFDCRNGFLGVDYIGLDTSYDKIEDYPKCQGGSPPPPLGGGVRPPIFF